MSDMNRPAPFLSLWFGNFFEPAYSDMEFIKNGVADIKQMGFDAVLTDSKAWQDFFDRYEGKEASQYLIGQEYMQKCIQEQGLHHWFLSVYLCGDNLYPNIRTSPPVIGEGIVTADGKPYRYYKYWSEKAQQSMLDHVKGLFSLYSDNHAAFTLDGKTRLPMTSMWDPIALPSFDEDGVARYRSFLAARYRTIEDLNLAYETDFYDFEEITPQDWLIDYEREPMTESDMKAKNGRFYRHGDLMLYKVGELVGYFSAMKEKFAALDEKLYLAPNLSQWSIFLNINRNDPNDLWDTANRGLDPYRIAPYVDSATFMTVPQMANGSANAYVTEYQNSMMRAMNEGRPFLTGFYLGKHTEGDIYRELTPAEIIGSAVASGAFGYTVYGYLGLDDGGVMHKLPAEFKDSVRVGNAWARKVLPKLDQKHIKQAAILFPHQMALMENYTVNGNADRRLDSLGWYQICSDAGIMADVIHEDQIENGILSDYRVLILPENDCYAIDPNPQAMQAVMDFVKQGGSVYMSCFHPYAKKVFGLRHTNHPKQCVRFGDGLILNEDDFAALRDITPLAVYEDSGATAIGVKEFGKGKVYLFGFAGGLQYAAPRSDSVPPKYGNRDYYPINLVQNDPMRVLLCQEVTPQLSAYTKDGTLPQLRKNIAFSVFEDALVIVNHSSYPYDLGQFAGTVDAQYACGDMLLPHSAAVIYKGEKE